jgi:hypothetical protein
MLLFGKVLRYFLVLPPLVRLIERLLDGVVGRFMLQTVSVNSIKENYHREHEKYDFVKWQKGELVVEYEDSDVYLCNQTSFIEFLWLQSQYSPIFTK